MSALRDLPLLAANLRRLADVPSRVAPRAAAGITSQIRQDTGVGRDCYGRPFAPLKPATLAKGRTPPPMIDTTDSLGETRAFPLRGAGIGVHIGGWYKYHLTKTKTRAARQVAPVRGGLPAAWRARVQAAVDAMTRDAMR